MLIALNKPYGVLSQFTPESGSRWRTLADFALPPHVYAIGRLDADSEGLLLLSDEPGLNSRLLDPAHRHPREYWAQVERVPDVDALLRLSKGVRLGDHRCLPCRVRRLEQPPDLPPRDPPIRYRKNVSDAWISLELIEGKNRQVRRMTAAVGHPTLRLIRVRINRLTLDSLRLAPGTWRELTANERKQVDGERRTEDRELRTEDRGQRTEDGGWRTENRRPRTENRGQKAEGARTEDWGRRTSG